MPASLWISTAYVHPSSETDRFVALLAFAESRDAFEQLVKSTFHAQNIPYYYQLAPLKAEVFFQRHGRTWLLHQAGSLAEDELRVIALNDETPQPVREGDITYLHCHVIDNIKPLDMQLDRIPALFAPEAIAQLLWPDFAIAPNLLDFANKDKPVQLSFARPLIDERVKARHLSQYGKNAENAGEEGKGGENYPLPKLKTYFVLDANKMPFFHTLSLKAKMKSLFQGRFGDDTAKVAPYLIEVIRDEEHIHTGEMMGLFSLKSALHDFNWEDNLGIFIHSYADFDRVYHHLRKFPVLQDERGKWFFFRFYDPKVLRDYLAIIAKHPAKLNKFFGYDTNIIYAFGSGFGDSFHYYTLKALPEDMLSAPVVMTDWEMAGFKEQKWHNSRQDYLDEIWQNYNDNFIEEDKKQILKYLDNAVSEGYENQRSIILYALALFYSDKKAENFDLLKSSLLQQGYNKDEIAILLYKKLK
ncbi:DUF4123 domain-containing protein [Aggregatibacter actinomycetemcomitans]|uniref:DUF4123 domain-containing protein n=1 Tax=Aggregatibacter actinomycetemcomitans TaxID=714 RepID=UPI0021508C98|nr:DUF4123 domain-containing protein [Aggregatibacter actinomycetemcomitans]